MPEDYSGENHGQASYHLQEHRNCGEYQNRTAHWPSRFPSYELQRERRWADSKELLDCVDQKQSLVHMGQRHRTPRPSDTKEQHGQILKKSDSAAGQELILDVIKQRKRKLDLDFEE